MTSSRQVPGEGSGTPHQGLGQERTWLVLSVRKYLSGVMFERFQGGKESGGRVAREKAGGMVEAAENEEKPAPGQRS